MDAISLLHHLKKGKPVDKLKQDYGKFNVVI